jgi:hypothetical protein
MNDLQHHLTGPIGFVLAFLALVFALLTILMPYYVFVCAREMMRTRKLMSELLAVMRTRR